MLGVLQGTWQLLLASGDIGTTGSPRTGCCCSCGPLSVGANERTGLEVLLLLSGTAMAASIGSGLKGKVALITGQWKITAFLCDVYVRSG